MPKGDEKAKRVVRFALDARDVAAVYEKARYGEYRTAENGESVLVAMPSTRR